MDDEAARHEYDYYLGIFIALGVGLGFLSGWYAYLYGGYPYAVLTCVVVGLELAIPAAYSRRHHLLGNTVKPPISLNKKKAALIVSLAVYVVAASLLTMWGGGRTSSAANMLVLTIVVSVYVAKQTWTKIAIAVVALLSYLWTSIYWFDSVSKTMKWENSVKVFADVAVVVFVVIVSAVTSREIANRQRASSIR